MCPIVLPAEALQRRFWSRIGKPFTLAWKWPKKLSNIWLQNILFMITSLFIVVLVTQPLATGIMVGGLIGGAIVAFMLFERRAFCRYICPVSGFIGLYSMFAPTELRVKDSNVCVKGKTVVCKKDCYAGNERGYGCPWFELTQTKDRNAYCGLCGECLKTCPNDNVAFNARPFAADLLVTKKRKFDEAWKSIMMLTLAVLYTVVLMGPWSWLKDWGNYWFWSSGVGFPQHLLYAVLIVGIVFGIVPTLHLGVAKASKALARMKDVTVKRLFVDFAYAYVPLGLMLWIGFSLTLLVVNWAYIPVTMSDPFGFGWNLAGTKEWAWSPISWVIPPAMTALALLGLGISINVGYNISRQLFPDEKTATRALVPVVAFMAGMTIVFLWMFV